jgi:hypothetical protein
VVAQAYLNPSFHQQFAQQPVDAVLNTAKTEQLTIGREEAETIAKDARTVIAPFIGIEAKNLVQDISPIKSHKALIQSSTCPESSSTWDSRSSPLLFY